MQDVTPFDSFTTSFNLSADTDTFTVIGTSRASGKSTSLQCPRQGRNFNWADVTLEVYGIQSCPMFSPGEMAFERPTLWDTSYRPLTPQWTLSPRSPCGGSIIVDPEAHGAVHISHDA